MVDMSTSDGRFLFFLPWMGHVLVGICMLTLLLMPSTDLHFCVGLDL
jgi:hypothetical protein